MITVRRIPFTILYAFNVAVWLLIVYFGFDKQQILRDALPASLGLAIFTTIHFSFQFTVQVNTETVARGVKALYDKEKV